MFYLQLNNNIDPPLTLKIVTGQIQTESFVAVIKYDMGCQYFWFFLFGYLSHNFDSK